MNKVVSLRPDYAEQLLCAVREYIAADFRVVPLPSRSKAPKIKGWKDRVFAEADFRSDSNLALRLDAGLCDVDLDWVEARELAEELLPLTAWFGRASATPSHMLYTCAGLEKSLKFSLPASFSEDARFTQGEHALTVLEIRAGQSVMAPPSIHPSGEVLNWGTCETVHPIDADKLQRRCGLIAVLSVALRCYPASGTRNDVCIALSGALVRAGFDPGEADELTRLVAEVAGDEEASQRGAGENAARRIAESKDVAGLPKLCELLSLPPELARLFAKWLGQDGPDASAILLDNDREPENLDRMDALFAASGLPHFQRLGRRVHVCRLAATGEEGAGPLAIRECSKRVIQQDIERLARFQKFDARRSGGGGYVPAQCPDRLAEMYLCKSNGWTVPELRGVRESPTLRSVGSVLQTPGYDRQTGYLFEPRTAYPAMADQPTREHAVAALAEVKHVLRDFRFASEADLAAALALILMAVTRPALSTAPMVAIDAPQYGAGKTLLANLAAIIGLGALPVAKGWATSEEENEKRLYSALLAGEPIYLADNIPKGLPLGGEALAAVLTQPEWAARLLGRSEQPAVSTRTLIIATGVNVTVTADIVRRALKCRIEPGVERPEAREFDYDIIEETLTNHPALLIATLTMVRAYVVAGYPMRGAFKPLGSFADFDRLVRGPLIWLGCEDPVATQRDIEAVDPEIDTLARGLEVLEAVFGGGAFQVRDISAVAIKASPTIGELALLGWVRETLPPGRDAQPINAPALGKYLKANRGAPRGGRKLGQVKAGTPEAGGKLGRDGAIWRIEQVGV